MEKEPQQPKKYEFEGGDFLNPEKMPPLPEDDAEKGEEIWNVCEENMEMISGEVFDAAVRPNMTEEEIQKLAQFYVSEYENEQLIEEKEQNEEEEVEEMKEAKENRREVSGDLKEGDGSGMSLSARAVEMIKEYLNEHPAVSKLVFPAIVASQLAGCATGGYYYGRAAEAGMYGQYRIEQTLAYGQNRAAQRESYGNYRSQSALERGMLKAEQHRSRAYASLRREATPEDTARIEAEYDNRVQEAEMRAKHIEDETGMQVQRIMGNTEMKAQRIATSTEMRQQRIQMQMAGRMFRHAMHGIYSGHYHPHHW
jgi:hypothetical protein